jgi:hypothetical protein
MTCSRLHGYCNKCRTRQEACQSALPVPDDNASTYPSGFLEATLLANGLRTTKRVRHDGSFSNQRSLPPLSEYGAMV